jgi:excisionase family DNA binding protein
MADRLEAALAELAAAIREEIAAAGQPGPDRLLTVDEAAQAMGLGRSLVYDLIGATRLRSLKVGRRRLVPASAVAEFVQAQSDA